MNPICLYAGAATSPNVARLLSNLYELLNDRYPIDIVAGRPEELHLDAPEMDICTYEPPTLLGGRSGLARYASENDPSVIVQVTDPPVHGTVVGTVAARQGIPAVYRYAGDRFYEYRVARGHQRVTAFALGSVLGRVPLLLANRYIVLGPTGRRRLIARGVDPNDIIVLPPTIDPEPFRDAVPVSHGVPPDRKIALFVGRVSHLKGQEVLEDAIPAVLRRRDDIHFVIVGPANDDFAVPPWCCDRVTQVGPVPPEEVPGYMQVADVLIHPSLTDGVPRVVMEALAAETPVLARDVGDVSSVTDNTFDTDEEFVERLCSFDELPLDDINPFTTTALAPRYRTFFEQFECHH